jgi:tryptophan synthase alpha chain
MVSSSSTTGIKSVLSAGQQAYFERVQAMKLRNPKLIGFGISDTASFRGACNMAEGAIIGSAFIKMLANIGTGSGDISAFIRELRS